MPDGEAVTRWIACDRKQGYEDVRAARRHAEALTRKYRHWRNIQYEPYECRYCGLFHVGKRRESAA